MGARCDGGLNLPKNIQKHHVDVTYKHPYHAMLETPSPADFDLPEIGGSKLPHVL